MLHNNWVLPGREEDNIENYDAHREDYFLFNPGVDLVYDTLRPNKRLTVDNTQGVEKPWDLLLDSGCNKRVTAKTFESGIIIVDFRFFLTSSCHQDG